MFSKPLSFALVYVLSVINFTIILFPLMFFLVPVLFIDVNDGLNRNIVALLWLSAFIISILMLIYIFFDFIFGFSVRSLTKNCRNYEKIRNYTFLRPIIEQAKAIYGVKRVRLLIENSNAINAYAVASTGNRNVILTTGIINHFMNSTQTEDEFTLAISGVIGHEMSHLVNKDFLPGLLLKISERATTAVSFIVNIIFRILCKILTIIPVIGIPLNNLIIRIYNLIYKLIISFHKYIVVNLYMFVLKQISKSIEYRCDRDSCYAFGNNGMQYALSMLGDSGYFTIFSTHPSTKSRIKKARKIHRIKNRIRVNIINRLSNALSILGVLYLSVLAGLYADIPHLIESYGHNASELQHMYYDIKYKILQFIHANFKVN